jgi:transposase InsO family protein
VIDALEMAWFARHPDKNAGLIFHSDRGSQYASEDFSDVLKEYQFAHGEPGAKKTLTGVAAGTGIAVMATNVLTWLWGS